MDFMTNDMSLALYAITAICGVGLLTVWYLSNRNQRNAGFASKTHLKRQLSAKAVLKATEIRPSLTDRDHAPTFSAVQLTKNRTVSS